jgi:hypothetical protein
MKTRMQKVLEGITDAQAKIVWELPAGFVENSSDYEEDPTKVREATDLMGKLDAAHASYAEAHS